MNASCVITEGSIHIILSRCPYKQTDLAVSPFIMLKVPPMGSTKSVDGIVSGITACMKFVSRASIVSQALIKLQWTIPKMLHPRCGRLNNRRQLISRDLLKLYQSLRWLCILQKVSRSRSVQIVVLRSYDPLRHHFGLCFSTFTAVGHYIVSCMNWFTAATGGT